MTKNIFRIGHHTKHVSTKEACFAAIKDMQDHFGKIPGEHFLSFVRTNPKTFCTEILTKPIILNF